MTIFAADVHTTSKIGILDASAMHFAQLDTAFGGSARRAGTHKTMNGHAKAAVLSGNELIAYLIDWNTPELLA